jgi:hypothetical protein
MSRICHLFMGEAVRTDLDWSLAMMGIAYWTFQCDGSRWAGTDAPRQCHSVRSCGFIRGTDQPVAGIAPQVQ